MVATMTSKGQITIPLEIREQLGLDAGTQLEFEVADGRLVAHKVVFLRAVDLWMTHAAVAKELDASFEQAEQGKASEAVEFDEFAEQLSK
jgi:AbrB family looped-hinge helix DNA binding protein